MRFLKPNVLQSLSTSGKELTEGQIRDLVSKIIIHPSTINLEIVKCPMCDHLLGFVDGRVQIKCNKCKYIHLADSRVAPTTDTLI